MSKLRPRSEGQRHDDSDSHEALLISAFLETGEFNPSAYAVVDDDIEAWAPVWDMCARYAEHTGGHAPPISLVTTRFPDFKVIEDVRVEYAADEVRRQAAERDLRVSTREVVNLLNEGDLEGAFGAVADVRPLRVAKTKPASVFDVREVAHRNMMHRIEVPYPSLQRATGGIAQTDLWYIAARTSHGKTWQLLSYAARAAAAGHKVGMLSLEMPHSQVAVRALTTMSGGDKEILADLRSKEEEDWYVAVEAIKKFTPGTLEVYDHSHGPIATTDFVRDITGDYDLVLVDHMGLMTKGGQRAVDDWRVQASISNELRAIVLATSTPVLAAVQINREGDRGPASRPPKMTTISGSDALGQDGDVVITMRRWSKKVMVQSAEKVRDGEEQRFYSWFDPRRGRFSEMTYDQALAQHDADGGDYRDED